MALAKRVIDLGLHWSLPSVPAQLEILDAEDMAAIGGRCGARPDPEGRDAAQELLEPDDQLPAGEVRPQAAMRPISESIVAIGLTRDVYPVGIGKFCWFVFVVFGRVGLV